MRKISNYFIGLIIVFPFFSFIRFPPSPDWYFSAISIVGLGVAFVLFAWRNVQLDLSVMSVGLLLFLLACIGSGHVKAPEELSVLLLLSLFSLYVKNGIDGEGRSEFIVSLCMLFFCASLVQVLLGYIQIMGLAPYFNGFVVYDAVNPRGNIMGNIGQRNQYAQFLTWGLVAACYLYSIRKLRALFFWASIVLFSLLISWSGARLIILYGLMMCFLSWIWLRTSHGDAVVKRMAFAISGAVILVVLVQIFNHQLCQILAYIGMPIDVESGSDRVMAAGVGARRRIEWSKAWDIFLSHPFFGVGLRGYAAESVRLEAFGGWPKSPESWLFNNSHNLIFQLLAETGLVGLLPVVICLVMIFWGYLKFGAKSGENLFLLSVFSVIVIHSLFEYPLWYLPFILCLVVVGVLAPLPSVNLKLRGLIVRTIAVCVAVLCLVNFLIGHGAYKILFESQRPTANVTENVKRIKSLVELGANPFWRDEADMELVAYFQPTKDQFKYKIDHFERLAEITPYPEVLFKLSILRALDGQAKKSQEALVLAIANYPDFVDAYVANYARYNFAEIEPLKKIAKRAAEEYAAHGGNTEAGRIAAVMTVAAPVTRKALF
ncbi:PglL family O-oligosaccharyltransferase [Aquitalea pelogenes]|uniref:PglL family O-oligosaccharyltransferase n=1 Tax=Aquitalea pelogenes TaxID=1293573 RepID=UPI0009E960FF|nr:Wzy polymerase domain-containing protein [Aquitalea pelogenes]